MNFYHGYRFEDVLREKAHIFFTLLNEMYKIYAIEKIQDINVVSVPHMKRQDAMSVVSTYRQMAEDPVESLSENNDYSQLDNLRKNLSG